MRSLRDGMLQTALITLLFGVVFTILFSVAQAQTAGAGGGCAPVFGDPTNKTRVTGAYKTFCQGNCVVESNKPICKLDGQKVEPTTKDGQPVTGGQQNPGSVGSYAQPNLLPPANVNEAQRQIDLLQQQAATAGPEERAAIDQQITELRNDIDEINRLANQPDAPAGQEDVLQAQRDEAQQRLNRAVFDAKSLQPSAAPGGPVVPASGVELPPTAQNTGFNTPGSAENMPVAEQLKMIGEAASKFQDSLKYAFETTKDFFGYGDPGQTLTNEQILEESARESRALDTTKELIAQVNDAAACGDKCTPAQKVALDAAKAELKDYVNNTLGGVQNINDPWTRDALNRGVQTPGLTGLANPEDMTAEQIQKAIDTASNQTKLVQDAEARFLNLKPGDSVGLQDAVSNINKLQEAGLISAGQAQDTLNKFGVAEVGSGPDKMLVLGDPSQLNALQAELAPKLAELNAVANLTEQNVKAGLAAIERDNKLSSVFLDGPRTETNQEFAQRTANTYEALRQQYDTLAANAARDADGKPIFTTPADALRAADLGAKLNNLATANQIALQAQSDIAQAQSLTGLAEAERPALPSGDMAVTDRATITADVEKAQLQSVIEKNAQTLSELKSNSANFVPDPSRPGETINRQALINRLEAVNAEALARIERLETLQAFVNSDNPLADSVAEKYLQPNSLPPQEDPQGLYEAQNKFEKQVMFDKLDQLQRDQTRLETLQSRTNDVFSGPSRGALADQQARIDESNRILSEVSGAKPYSADTQQALNRFSGNGTWWEKTLDNMSSAFQGVGKQISELGGRSITGTFAAGALDAAVRDLGVVTFSPTAQDVVGGLGSIQTDRSLSYGVSLANTALNATILADAGVALGKSVSNVMESLSILKFDTNGLGAFPGVNGRMAESLGADTFGLGTGGYKLDQSFVYVRSTADLPATAGEIAGVLNYKLAEQFIPDAANLNALNDLVSGQQTALKLAGLEIDNAGQFVRSAEPGVALRDSSGAILRAYEAPVSASPIKTFASDFAESLSNSYRSVVYDPSIAAQSLKQEISATNRQLDALNAERSWYVNQNQNLDQMIANAGKAERINDARGLETPAGQVEQTQRTLQGLAAENSTKIATLDARIAEVATKVSSLERLQLAQHDVVAAKSLKELVAEVKGPQKSLAELRGESALSEVAGPVGPTKAPLTPASETNVFAKEFPGLSQRLDAAISSLKSIGEAMNPFTPGSYGSRAVVTVEALARASAALLGGEGLGTAVARAPIAAEIKTLSGADLAAQTKILQDFRAGKITLDTGESLTTTFASVRPQAGQVGVTNVPSGKVLASLEVQQIQDVKVAASAELRGSQLSTESSVPRALDDLIKSNALSVETSKVAEVSLGQLHAAQLVAEEALSSGSRAEITAATANLESAYTQVMQTATNISPSSQVLAQAGIISRDAVALTQLPPEILATAPVVDQPAARSPISGSSIIGNTLLPQYFALLKWANLLPNDRNLSSRLLVRADTTPQPQTSPSPLPEIVREGLSRAITPIGYGTTPDTKQWNKLQLDNRQDAWRTYLELPQLNSTLAKSEFKPGKSVNPNTKYLKINNYLDNLVAYAKGGGEDLLKDLYDLRRGANAVPIATVQTKADAVKYLLNVADVLAENKITGSPFTAIDDKSSFIMNHYTVFKGNDDLGPYLSYYDRWDLKGNSVERVNGLFGTPFEIYDRIYYNPDTFEPVEKALTKADSTDAGALRQVVAEATPVSAPAAPSTAANKTPAQLQEESALAIFTANYGTHSFADLFKSSLSQLRNIQLKLAGQGLGSTVTSYAVDRAVADRGFNVYGAINHANDFANAQLTAPESAERQALSIFNAGTLAATAPTEAQLLSVRAGLQNRGLADTETALAVQEALETRGAPDLSIANEVAGVTPIVTAGQSAMNLGGPVRSVNDARSLSALSDQEILAQGGLAVQALNTYWKSTLGSMGTKWTDVAVKIDDTLTSPAAYDDETKTLLINPSKIKSESALAKTDLTVGTFKYLLAHEMGHHVQQVLGADVAFGGPAEAINPADVRSRGLELWADDLAGRGLVGAGLERQGDRVEVSAYLNATGDNADAQMPHGSGSERVAALERGFAANGTNGLTSTYPYREENAILAAKDVFSDPAQATQETVQSAFTKISEAQLADTVYGKSLKAWLDSTQSVAQKNQALASAVELSKQTLASAKQIPTAQINSLFGINTAAQIPAFTTTVTPARPAGIRYLGGPSVIDLESFSKTNVRADLTEVFAGQSLPAVSPQSQVVDSYTYAAPSATRSIGGVFVSGLADILFGGSAQAAAPPNYAKGGENPTLDILQIGQAYGKFKNFDGNSFAQSMNAMFEKETTGVPNSRNNIGAPYQGSFQMGTREFAVGLKYAIADIEEMKKTGAVSDEVYKRFQDALVSAKSMPDARFHHVLNAWASMATHAQLEAQIQKYTQVPVERAALHMGIQLAPSKLTSLLSGRNVSGIGNNGVGGATMAESIRQMAYTNRAYVSSFTKGIQLMSEKIASLGETAPGITVASNTPGAQPTKAPDTQPAQTTKPAAQAAVTSPYLAQMRAPYIKQIKDNPNLRTLVAALLSLENKRDINAVLESMLNRSAMYVAQGRGGYTDLNKTITDGFYGPYNRGAVQSYVRRGVSAADYAAADRAIAEVAAGSDICNMCTDQGMKSEIKGQKWQVTTGGEEWFGHMFGDARWGTAQRNQKIAFDAKNATPQIAVANTAPEVPATLAEYLKTDVIANNNSGIVFKGVAQADIGDFALSPDKRSIAVMGKAIDGVAPVLGTLTPTPGQTAEYRFTNDQTKSVNVAFTLPKVQDGKTPVIAGNDADISQGTKVAVSTPAAPSASAPAAQPTNAQTPSAIPNGLREQLLVDIRTSIMSNVVFKGLAEPRIGDFVLSSDKQSIVVMSKSYEFTYEESEVLGTLAPAPGKPGEYLFTNARTKEVNVAFKDLKVQGNKVSYTRGSSEIVAPAVAVSAPAAQPASPAPATVVQNPGTVTTGGVTLNGVPYAQLSALDQIKQGDRLVQSEIVKALKAQGKKVVIVANPGKDKPFPFYKKVEDYELAIQPGINIVAHVSETPNATIQNLIRSGLYVKTERGGFMNTTFYVDCSPGECTYYIVDGLPRTNHTATKAFRSDSPKAASIFNANSFGIEIHRPREEYVTAKDVDAFATLTLAIAQATGGIKQVASHAELNTNKSQPTEASGGEGYWGAVESQRVLARAGLLLGQEPTSPAVAANTPAQTAPQRPVSITDFAGLRPGAQPTSRTPDAPAQPASLAGTPGYVPGSQDKIFDVVVPKQAVSQLIANNRTQQYNYTPRARVYIPAGVDLKSPDTKVVVYLFGNNTRVAGFNDKLAGKDAFDQKASQFYGQMLGQKAILIVPDLGDAPGSTFGFFDAKAPDMFAPVYAEILKQTGVDVSSRSADLVMFSGGGVPGRTLLQTQKHAGQFNTPESKIVILDGIFDQTGSQWKGILDTYANAGFVSIGTPTGYNTTNAKTATQMKAKLYTSFTEAPAVTPGSRVFINLQAGDTLASHNNLPSTGLASAFIKAPATLAETLIAQGKLPEKATMGGLVKTASGDLQAFELPTGETVVLKPEATTAFSERTLNANDKLLLSDLRALNSPSLENFIKATKSSDGSRFVRGDVLAAWLPILESFAAKYPNTPVEFTGIGRSAEVQKAIYARLGQSPFMGSNHLTGLAVDVRVLDSAGKKLPYVDELYKVLQADQRFKGDLTNPNVPHGEGFHIHAGYRGSPTAAELAYLTVKVPQVQYALYTVNPGGELSSYGAGEKFALGNVAKTVVATAKVPAVTKFSQGLLNAIKQFKQNNTILTTDKLTLLDSSGAAAQIRRTVNGTDSYYRFAPNAEGVYELTAMNAPSAPAAQPGFKPVIALGNPGEVFAQAALPKVTSADTIKEQAKTLQGIVQEGKVYRMPIAVMGPNKTPVILMTPETRELDTALKAAGFANGVPVIYSNKTFLERGGDFTKVLQTRASRLLERQADIESGKLSGQALSDFFSSQKLSSNHGLAYAQDLRALILMDQVLGAASYVWAGTENGHGTHGRDVGGIGRDFDVRILPLAFGTDFANVTKAVKDKTGAVSEAAIAAAWAKAWWDVQTTDEFARSLKGQFKPRLGIYSDKAEVHIGVGAGGGGWNLGRPADSPTLMALYAKYKGVRPESTQSIAWDTVFRLRDASVYGQVQDRAIFLAQSQAAPKVADATPATQAPVVTATSKPETPAAAPTQAVPVQAPAAPTQAPSAAPAEAAPAQVPVAPPKVTPEAQPASAPTAPPAAPQVTAPTVAETQKAPPVSPISLADLQTITDNLVLEVKPVEATAPFSVAGLQGQFAYAPKLPSFPEAVKMSEQPAAPAVQKAELPIVSKADYDKAIAQVQSLVKGQGTITGIKYNGGPIVIAMPIVHRIDYMPGVQSADGKALADRIQNQVMSIVAKLTVSKVTNVVAEEGKTVRSAPEKIGAFTSYGVENNSIASLLLSQFTNFLSQDYVTKNAISHSATLKGGGKTALSSKILEDFYKQENVTKLIASYTAGALSTAEIESSKARLSLEVQKAFDATTINNDLKSTYLDVNKQLFTVGDVMSVVERNKDISENLADIVRKSGEPIVIIDLGAAHFKDEINSYTGVVKHKIQDSWDAQGLSYIIVSPDELVKAGRTPALSLAGEYPPSINDIKYEIDKAKEVAANITAPVTKPAETIVVQPAAAEPAKPDAARVATDKEVQDANRRVADIQKQIVSNDAAIRQVQNKITAAQSAPTFETVKQIAQNAMPKINAIQSALNVVGAAIEKSDAPNAAGMAKIKAGEAALREVASQIRALQADPDYRALTNVTNKSNKNLTFQLDAYIRQIEILKAKIEKYKKDGGISEGLALLDYAKVVQDTGSNLLHTTSWYLSNVIVGADKQIAATPNVATLSTQYADLQVKASTLAADLEAAQGTYASLTNTTKVTATPTSVPAITFATQPDAYYADYFPGTALGSAVAIPKATTPVMVAKLDTGAPVQADPVVQVAEPVAPTNTGLTLYEPENVLASSRPISLRAQSQDIASALLNKPLAIRVVEPGSIVTSVPVAAGSPPPPGNVVVVPGSISLEEASVGAGQPVANPGLWRITLAYLGFQGLYSDSDDSKADSATTQQSMATRVSNMLLSFVPRGVTLVFTKTPSRVSEPEPDSDVYGLKLASFGGGSDTNTSPTPPAAPGTQPGHNTKTPAVPPAAPSSDPNKTDTTSCKPGEFDMSGTTPVPCPTGTDTPGDKNNPGANPGTKEKPGTTPGGPDGGTPGGTEKPSDSGFNPLSALAPVMNLLKLLSQPTQPVAPVAPSVSASSSPSSISIPASTQMNTSAGVAELTPVAVGSSKSQIDAIASMAQSSTQQVTSSATKAIQSIIKLAGLTQDNPVTQAATETLTAVTPASFFSEFSAFLKSIYVPSSGYVSTDLKDSIQNTAKVYTSPNLSGLSTPTAGVVSAGLTLQAFVMQAASFLESYLSRMPKP